MRTAGEAEEAATGGQKELPVRIQLSSPEEFGSRSGCRRVTVIKRAASRDRSGLDVRGKSRPWSFSTRATLEQDEGFRGCQSRHPAAAGVTHILLEIIS